MKVAGRKNDGAWYRTNKVIQSLGLDERAALKDVIAGMPETADFLTSVQAFYAAAGLSGDSNYPDDVDALAANYTTFGIPRQAWMGVLSYDTYTRTGSEGDYTYTPVHQAAAFAFGKAIRKQLKSFTFARRQAKDLTNIAPRTEGNPGGIADASPGN